MQNRSPQRLRSMLLQSVIFLLDLVLLLLQVTLRLFVEQLLINRTFLVAQQQNGRLQREATRPTHSGIQSKANGPVVCVMHTGHVFSSAGNALPGHAPRVVFGVLFAPRTKTNTPSAEPATRRMNFFLKRKRKFGAAGTAGRQ